MISNFGVSVESSAGVAPLGNSGVPAVCSGAVSILRDQHLAHNRITQL